MFWTSVPAGANDDALLLAQRGQILEDQGAHEAALAAFTHAIALNALPPNEQARLLYARGIVRDVEGQHSGALDDYSAALRLVPGFAPALNNRANLYRRQNRLSEAKRDYLASLAAGNPQPEYSWCGLGEIAEVQGDRASARQDYTRAVTANPGYKPALDRLAAFGGGPSVALLPPIHLRPPKAKPALAPARYEPPGPSILRPALDSSPVPRPQVQLGAWRSEAQAGDAWDRAVRQQTVYWTDSSHGSWWQTCRAKASITACAWRRQPAPRLICVMRSRCGVLRAYLRATRPGPSAMAPGP